MRDLRLILAAICAAALASAAPAVPARCVGGRTCEDRAHCSREAAYCGVCDPPVPEGTMGGATH